MKSPGNKPVIDTTGNDTTRNDTTNMTTAVDNSGEADYDDKLRTIARKLRDWQGPMVLVSHVDPDGDALGSVLALGRALTALGKEAEIIIEPPHFLAFLAHPDELSEAREALAPNTLLLILDAAEAHRAYGAPLEQAAFSINIDHHGTNDRFGDLALVEPGKAATAEIVKDLIDVLGVPWTPQIATPCLTGILTDTGNFRYSNTTPAVLRTAGELIEAGVDYAGLTDRLQWRRPQYFSTLGRVMSTVSFPLGGLVAMAYLSVEMLEQIAADAGDLEGIDDSNDFVGLIRYAEGAKVAIFLKEREDHTKVSVRTRDGVSAQAICLALGGGGHVAAAGAKVHADLAETRKRVLAAAREELARHGLLGTDLAD